MKWLAVLLGILIFAALFSNAEGANPILTIVGEGTATVPADVATFSITVESNNDNMTMAQVEVQDKMNRVIDALRTAGVKDDEILPGQSSGISSFQSSSRVCRQENNSTICENKTQQASSMKRSTVIRIKAQDESRIKSVIEAAKSAGASADVAGYDLSDSGTAVAEARKKAVAIARENAEGMATAAGVRLGNILDISDYAYPDVSMDESGSEAGNPGMVDVTSYVIVTYEIIV